MRGRRPTCRVICNSVIPLSCPEVVMVLGLGGKAAPRGTARRENSLIALGLVSVGTGTPRRAPPLCGIAWRWAHWPLECCWDGRAVQMYRGGDTGVTPSWHGPLSSFVQHAVRPRPFLEPWMHDGRESWPSCWCAHAVWKVLSGRRQTAQKVRL